MFHESKVARAENQEIQRPDEQTEVHLELIVPIYTSGLLHGHVAFRRFQDRGWKLTGPHLRSWG